MNVKRQRPTVTQFVRTTDDACRLGSRLLLGWSTTNINVGHLYYSERQRKYKMDVISYMDTRDDTNTIMDYIIMPSSRIPSIVSWRTESLAVSTT